MGFADAYGEALRCGWAWATVLVLVCVEGESCGLERDHGRALARLEGGFAWQTALIVSLSLPARS